MPANAKKDLLEWNNTLNAPDYLGLVITNEYSLPSILNSNLDLRITDDQPFNEYFLLRRLEQ